MTCKALTTLLALIALPMSAMAGQSTIYVTDGNVVDRYTADSQGTTTLAATVGSLAAPLATSPMHDGMSGQVFGDRPKWGNGESARPISRGRTKPPDQQDIGRSQ